MVKGAGGFRHPLQFLLRQTRNGCARARRNGFPLPFAFLSAVADSARQGLRHSQSGLCYGGGLSRQRILPFPGAGLDGLLRDKGCASYACSNSKLTNGPPTECGWITGRLLGTIRPQFGFIGQHGGKIRCYEQVKGVAQMRRNPENNRTFS